MNQNNKQLLLEKYIKVAVKKALKEQEAHQQRAEKAMYLIYRFPGLKKIVETLMSPSFGRFVNGIDIIAPKPTTFKVDLINGQDFSIIYLGNNNYSVKISGKKYYDKNIGEMERASLAIANLLELNYAPQEPPPNGNSGASPSSSPTPPPSNPQQDNDLAADLANPDNALPPEATIPQGIPPPGETAPPEDEENPAV